MYDPISVSNLNDFVFCPVSIYFQQLDKETDCLMYKERFQIDGTHAHRKPDSGEYSSKRNVLQGVSVYSEKYGLIGKIDTFDIDAGILTERKKKIKTIFDGYIFQLYAQYFALKEMGYTVNEIRLYSMDDNKVYSQVFPEENLEMLKKFERIITDIHSFSFEGFRQENSTKCMHCIYENMCSYSAKEG